MVQISTGAGGPVFTRRRHARIWVSGARRDGRYDRDLFGFRCRNRPSAAEGDTIVCRKRSRLAIWYVNAFWAATSSGRANRERSGRMAAAVVLRDCGAYGVARPSVVRPRHIACGAVGAPDFKKLHWSSWGGSNARAHGTVTYRDCPAATGCADPRNYHDVPVRVRVYRIRTCDGRRAYTRLRATFRDLDHRRDGYHLDLTMNWNACS